MFDENNQRLESEYYKDGSSEEQPDVVVDDDPSLLVRPEVRQGSFPGDEHIAFVRPVQPAFRRLGYGALEATEVTEAPHGAWGRIKRNHPALFICVEQVPWAERVLPGHDAWQSSREAIY